MPSHTHIDSPGMTSRQKRRVRRLHAIAERAGKRALATPNRVDMDAMGAAVAAAVNKNRRLAP